MFMTLTRFGYCSKYLVGNVLKIAESENINAGFEKILDSVTDLERKLYVFPEIVNRASMDLAPHHIVTYLIELAGVFNSFYAGNPIVDKNDETSSYKVALTSAFYITMTRGLDLLGMKIPHKM